MTWIAVGLCKDLPAGTVMPCCVDGLELAIWHSNSGRYHAWGDRCPHRGMRFSHGFVRGDRLACIYHGWQYGEDGGCRYIPAHPKLTPPTSICAQTYACGSQDGVIWVSPEGSEAPLPSAAGWQPVRSLPFEISAARIAAHFGQDWAPLLITDAPAPLAIALQPIGGRATMLHALAQPEADPKMISRGLEDLRRQLERAAA